MRSQPRMTFATLSLSSAALLLVALGTPSVPADDKGTSTLTGREALGDWTTDSPGVRRRITTDDLPKDYDTPSAKNQPKVVPRPDGAWPKAPEGFTVTEYASKLANPRKIVTAPNGDSFIAESQPGRIKLLRDADGDGKPELTKIFAGGLSQPFGIAFYPPGPRPEWIYVANTDSVVRFPYHAGDTEALDKPQTVVPDIPGGGRLTGGGHWTRDVVFSKDGKTMFVSVGSKSNVGGRRRREATGRHPPVQPRRVGRGGLRLGYPQRGRDRRRTHDGRALGLGQ